MLFRSPGVSRLSRPGRGREADRARCSVTRGWRRDEFWRVGPGKTGRVGQNETRPPPRMRWRGPCQAAPHRVGQLPGLPCTAGLPPVPATRQRPRFPGFFHVPEFPPSGARFRSVKYFLRPLRAARKRSGPFIFVLSLIHTMSTECARLSAPSWGYPPAYAQLVHR